MIPKRYAALAPYVHEGYTGYQVVVKQPNYDPITGQWDPEEDGGHTVEYGPYLSDALLLADVEASRWAKRRGLPYYG